MEKQKKLYRSRKDYLVAGVCGGLAKYFGIDPLLVRLAFVFLTLWGGSGILIYIVLWLLVPQEGGKEMIDEGVIEKIKKPEGKRLLGIILLGVGGVALLGQEMVWPIVLIGLGLLVIFK